MNAVQQPVAMAPDAGVRFAIVCPAYRCRDWIARSLQSIRNQTYRSFRCVVIDDVSGDGTLEAAFAAVAGDARFTVLGNEQRRFALANLVQATALAALSPQDVVVVVDADDWLRDERVLERLARVYADASVWLTYGSSELLRPTGYRARLKKLLGRPARCHAAPYPAFVRERSLYRYHPGRFLATHLRTYRKFLWDGIRDEDLRDERGAYFEATADPATMWPMMEMATDRHIRYIPDLLYVYNNDHALSDNRQRRSWYETEQFRINVLLRARKAYAPLEAAPPPERPLA